MAVVQILNFSEVSELVNAYVKDHNLDPRSSNHIFAMIFRKSCPDPPISIEHVKSFVDQHNLPEDQTDLLYDVISKQNMKYNFRPEYTLYDQKIVQEVLANIQIN